MFVGECGIFALFMLSHWYTYFKERRITVWLPKLIILFWSLRSFRLFFHFFVFFETSTSVLCPTHLPYHWVNGPLSFEVKRPWCKSEHLFPPNCWVWVIAAIPRSPPTFAIFEYRKQLFSKFLWILTLYLEKQGLSGSEVMIFNFHWRSYCNSERSNRPWR
jgi:hypothetical protein